MWGCDAPEERFVTYRKWIVIALAVLAAAPAVLAAQRTPRAPRPPRERAFAYAFGDNRGRIGVLVKTDADAEADKLGAKIEGVTPGGPAAKAGIKVGDIITKFNTTSLAGVKPEDEDESGPGHKLIELAHDLEPGDTVQVEYRRGNETKKATLVAEDLGPWSVMPRAEAMPQISPGVMMKMGEFCFGDTWCDLDLVTLNADLGEYFGTKEGILVVKAPADSALPLRAGDVIIKIGDRTPSSPSHAMKILRSYEAGESVSIEIMRKQKRTSITWKVPEPRERRMWKRSPEREDQTKIRQLLRSRTRLQRV